MLDEGAKSDEASVLRKMKRDCLKNLKGLIHNKKDVYMIDSRFPKKYDFEDLRTAVLTELLERRSEHFLKSLLDVIYKNSSMTQEDKCFAQVRDRVDRQGLSGINDFYHRQISSLKEEKIILAVTGVSRTGKSSFINTVRGLKAHEKQAAPVGVTESTSVPTKYVHSSNGNIIFWDLPGIGTPTSPNLQEYCKNVCGLQKYDAFIIFSKTRFTQHDKELAEKLSKELKKPFFFVRTNVDKDLENAKEDEGPQFNEESVLKKMRKDCLDNLKDFINDVKNIYMIDNKVPEKYDFDRLVKSISLVLPELKTECFILSLSNVTRKCTKSKAKFLKGLSFNIN
ncbi:T-cell-specific guanine nucleotide triphosphate-binding protein 2-like [Xenia sp. Carnegie-2017]|uniref:T-cell-specific guanine nucleotide triphosphate-binding protein 2-like n=1 Tax=Xenia sp. Carnegie-2017 TaxID=2897299 RepID=UPI001F04A00B|nr:T-cell-specific guanine nucleotide triphosphate-binding protein 2-like [Xenia sp. Carnegie-2017]